MNYVRSIGFRLTVWYAITAFSLVLFATGVLYWALVTNLDRVDDQFLQNEIHLTRTLLHDLPDDTGCSLAALREELSIHGEEYEKRWVEDEVLGDPRLPATVLRYPAIYGANRDHIRDPNLIYPGQLFKLPKS